MKSIVLLLLLACAIVCAAYDKTQIPGRLGVYTFDGSIPRPQSSKVATQTLEIPDAVAALHTNVNSNPEVLALLRMENDRERMAELTNRLNGASTSVQYSHVYRPEGAEAAVAPAPVFAHLTEKDDALFAHAKPMTLADFHAELVNKKHGQTPQLATSHPLNNGQVDRYVVTINSNQDMHSQELEMLQDITALAGKHTPITFVTLAEPTPHTVLPARESNFKSILAPSDVSAASFKGTGRRLSTDTLDGATYLPEGSEYSIYYKAKYLYITPDIFTGLLTMLFVLFVIVTGLNCLGAIQGPSSFVNKNPVVGREA